MEKSKRGNPDDPIFESSLKPRDEPEPRSSNNINDDGYITGDADESVNPLCSLWIPDVEQYVFPDMVGVVLPSPHERFIGKGLVIRADPDGVEIGDEKVTIDLDGIIQWKLDHDSVPGWYGSVAVRTSRPPSTHFFEMRFCPGKYFFGHNAFGPNNLANLVMRAYVDNLNRFDLHPEEHIWLDDFMDEAQLYELDITAMIDLGRRDAVRAVLECGEHGKHSRMGKPKRYQDTLVFGEGKKHYYSLKLYDKWSQMKSKEKKADYLSEFWKPALQWAEGKLRVEMHMKRKKLQQLGMTKVRDWTPEKMSELLRQQLNLISMPSGNPVASSVLENLKGKEKTVLKSVMAGDSLEEQFKSSGARTKYRKIFMEKGIDIDSVGNQEGSETMTVSVDWDDIKTRSFERPPDWAFDIWHPFPSAVAAIDEAYRSLSPSDTAALEEIERSLPT